MAMAANLQIINFLNKSQTIVPQLTTQSEGLRVLFEALIYKMLIQTSKAPVNALKEQIKKHQEEHEQLKTLMHIKRAFLKTQQILEQQSKKIADINYA
jgi:hypothetical protein